MTNFCSDPVYNIQCCLWNKTLKESRWCSSWLCSRSQVLLQLRNMISFFNYFLWDVVIVPSRELLSVCGCLCACVCMRLCICILVVLIDPIALPIDLCSWVQPSPWMWFPISRLKWVCENIKYNVNKSSYECERYYLSLHDCVSYYMLASAKEMLIQSDQLRQAGKSLKKKKKRW